MTSPYFIAAHSVPVYVVVTYVAIGWCIRAVMVPILLRREFAPGAAIAWLGILFLHPYIGLALYMTVGETRLGPGRAQRHRELIQQFRPKSLSNSAGRQTTNVEDPYEPMVLQAEKISGMPIVSGNNVEFIGNSIEMVNRLAADIDAAKEQVHLLYFIFYPDDSGNRIADALVTATGRGVKCRVIADAVASRVFFKFNGLARRLRDAGIETVAALPVAPFKRHLPRMDLRNHRKLAIIDQKIAYVGSQNLRNADYGGRRGAPWVDLSGRFTGPVVGELAIVFDEDWAFETGTDLEPRIQSDVVNSGATMSAQTVPTGPSVSSNGFRRVLLAAVQCARHRLILTTPYFVPDETTLVALMMAADRNVEVTLIVPLRADQYFAAMASRAHYARLLEAGIKIYQYRPGLIHAKTATVDDAFAILGSANLDVRSFNLNFELSVLMYGPEPTARLREIQLKYLADSQQIDAAEWAKRPRLWDYADRAVSLLSPLL
jgi:cardiolipin synthase